MGVSLLLDVLVWVRVGVSLGKRAGEGECLVGVRARVRVRVRVGLGCTTPLLLCSVPHP